MHPLSLSLLRRLSVGRPVSIAALQAELHADGDQLCEAVASLQSAGIALRDLGDAWVLEQSADLLDAASLRVRLRLIGSTLAAQLEVLDRCESTNTQLLQRASARSIHQQVVVAEMQTHGRGRRGRQWQSGLGDSLTLSLGWHFEREPAALSGLSLAVGVCCAQALESLGYQVALKWPNDLELNGAKLGGILIETLRSADGCSAVIGIGINVRDTAAGSDLERPAIALDAVKACKRDELCVVLLTCLERGLLRFEREGFAPFQAAWNGRNAHADRNVRMLLDGRETARGYARGVAEDGALLLETETGMQRIHAGEVSLREAA